MAAGHITCFVSLVHIMLVVQLPFVLLEEVSGQGAIYRPYVRRVAVGRWWCPRPEDISPCICDGPRGFPLIICRNLEAAHLLFRVFRSQFPTLELGKVSVSDSRIGSLERGTFGDVRFEYLSMSNNDLSRVERGSLEQSRHTVKRIEIVRSEVDKFPFQEIAGFSKLEHLDLHQNALTALPDYAFATNTDSKLKSIGLSFNSIKYVGSFAFQNLRALRSLDLSHNKLSVLNNDAFSIMVPNPKLTLDLSSNAIKYVSDGAFRNQMPQVLNLSDNALVSLPQNQFEGVLQGMATAKSGAVYTSGNRFQCTCDKVRWLLRLPQVYKVHIVEFRCFDLGNRRLDDIDLYTLQC